MTEDFGETNRYYTQERFQYQVALSLFNSKNLKGKVLDVGCGMGEFADMLRIKGYDVTCVDGVKRFTKETEKRGFNSFCVNLETQNLPFPNDSFDIVTSLSVIEHLWNTEHYLEEIRRISKKYILLTTANYDEIRYRIKHLLGHFGNYTYKSRHKKFYTYDSFIDESKQHFSIISRVGYVPRLGAVNLPDCLHRLFSVRIGILGEKRD